MKAKLGSWGLMLALGATLLAAAPRAEAEDAESIKKKLQRKVSFEFVDTSLPDGAARVIVQLTSGETFENRVMQAKGSLADPLSDRDVEAKVRDCARLGGTDWDLDRIIDGVWRLDTLADVASLMRVHG